MEERKRRRKRIRVNWPRLILAVVVIAVLLTGIGPTANVIKLSREQNRLKNEIRDLEERKADLEEEFKVLNDKNYIEEQARLQLKMIKPGEVLFVLGEENTGEEGEDSENDGKAKD